MMELCAVRVIHNLPPIHTHVQPLFPCSRAQSQSPLLLKHTRFTSGLRYCVNSPLSSTASEEISTKTADKPETDGVAIPAEEKKEDSTDRVESDGAVVTSYYTVESASVGEKKEDSDTSLDLQKILDDLDIKIDFEKNKYSILTFGGGGLIALWLASAVVGAVDRVPLLPKVLELVGLGYSIWFTIRYLIFEESRGEFAAKVGQVTQEIFGSVDD